MFPHYVPSLKKDSILSKRIISKAPTDLHYIESYVFMKSVNAHTF